jgi:hypothetical protein
MLIKILYNKFCWVEPRAAASRAELARSFLERAKQTRPGLVLTSKHRAALSRAKSSRRESELAR